MNITTIVICTGLAIVAGLCIWEHLTEKGRKFKDDFKEWKEDKRK